MKLFRHIALTAVAACLSLSVFSCAEAASVALLPLINNVADRDDLSSIYYDRAIEAVKLNPSLDVAEGTALDEAVKKYVKEGSLPDQAACEAIAAAAGVEYIFMMQTDKLYIDEPQNPHVDHINLILRGRCVSYDVSTGKYQNKKIVEEDDMPTSLSARYDVSGNQFGNSVTRELKKALGIKKFVLEKQRIGRWK